MDKAEKDLQRIVAKAKWLTPHGMETRRVFSRLGKSVWNTKRGLRARRQMGREMRLLCENTEYLFEEMESMLAHN